MPKGIGEIERLARSCPPGDSVKISPYMASQLVQFMNSTGQWSGHIERIYCGVAPTVLDGIVDQVRTRTISLVAEIIADMPEGTVTPSREVAENALKLTVKGKGHKIRLDNRQSGGTTTEAPAAEVPEESRSWHKVAWGTIGGLLTIAAVILALMEVQGWHF